jgi:L-fuculose-phosphate aldolase
VHGVGRHRADTGLCIDGLIVKPATDHNPNSMLVEGVRKLERLGLQRGGLGTVSVRSGGGLLVTPLALVPETLAVEDLVFIARDGGIKGRGQPSADWPLHQAIYTAHADVQAVVQLRSVHVAALASLERTLPAFHHRVAVAGGDSVPCVPYQTQGSRVLSAAVVEALGRRFACLIAHDGLVACAGTLTQASALAHEVEGLCQSYLAALAVAEPPRLERSEMARLVDRLSS